MEIFGVEINRESERHSIKCDTTNFEKIQNYLFDKGFVWSGGLKKEILHFNDIDGGSYIWKDKKVVYILLAFEVNNVLTYSRSFLTTYEITPDFRKIDLNKKLKKVKNYG